jgi:cephalosporin hydroxylase
MPTSPDYHGRIPSADEFARQRAEWQLRLANSDRIRDLATELFLAAAEYKYNYHWNWCGVPVIRTPDDICILQEIIWETRPSGLIETGVARGGGVALSASLMAGAGLEPRVLGIDLAIHPHTRAALAQTPWADKIELVEASSTSDSAVRAVQGFIAASPGRPVVLTLDSDHSHDHVLTELLKFGPALPSGSVIIVADTVIEDLPEDQLAGRPWGKGNSPATAIDAFLLNSMDFAKEQRWARRALITECRDGYLRRL